MKLIMENWKKFLEEQSQSSRALELIKGKPFCIGGQCRADVRAVDRSTGKVVAAAGSMGKTKEEALESAIKELKKKLQNPKLGG